MSKTKIITYDGSVGYREDCARIGDEFYIIGNPKVKDSGQCYPIKNDSGVVKRYRINSGLITWDYELEEYVLLNKKNLIQGLTPDGDGYFTQNIFKNVHIRNVPPYLSRSEARSSTRWCLDEETAKKKGAIYSILDGCWYLTGDVKKLNDYQYWEGKQLYATFPEVYSLSESGAFSKMKSIYDNKVVKSSSTIKELSKLLGGYSFGCEVETSMGRLQEKDLWDKCLVPLKDGSIDNHEYVTIPLSGAKGLTTFIEGMKLLQSHCRVDQKCSLHFHIGNVIEQEKNPKLFLITLYVLYYLLQKEIWQMIPPYKKSTEYLRTKRDFKDHCQDLNSLLLLDYRYYNDDRTLNEKELNAAFKVLFTFMNDGHEPDADHNYSTRRHVRAGRAKWEIHSRYYNLNLYNAFFSNSNTIEFRAHGGTTNLDKSLAWLLLCVGIVRYASKYSFEILTEQVKPSLDKVIAEFATNFGKEDIDPKYAQFVANYLKAYKETRQKEFVEMYLKGNIYGKEFQLDQAFSFMLKGQRLYDE